MTRRKQVDSLKQLCYAVIANDIHKIAVDIEENEAPSYMEKTALNKIAFNIPHSIVEQIIVKVIESIHDNVQRNRRTIGLITCLEVLLQPHIQKLNLSGLFFKMRLPGSFNVSIRKTMERKVVEMKNLTSFNLLSKCDDNILKAISLHCPNIVSIDISFSDLVTNQGMKDIATGCPLLERLEIYKCWPVTSEGIGYVLSASKNLKFFICDELGKVFLTNFKNTKKVFKLLHFEQTLTPFEPTEDETNFLAKICPNIESVRLYIDDDYLFCLPKLGLLQTLELELASHLGTNFSSIISQLSSLKTLQISCNSITKQQISLIGLHCQMLTTLHVTTATIEDDDNMVNDGKLYQNLNLLHFQIWKESSINVSLVDFFLLWCRDLTFVYLKAKMEFFTDEFLEGILRVNSLRYIKKIVFGSDKFIPLTIKSAHLLLDQCDDLENLSISSWQLSEEEYTSLLAYVKKNNLNCCVT